jgi:hypothetical protein
VVAIINRLKQEKVLNLMSGMEVKNRNHISKVHQMVTSGVNAIKLFPFVADGEAK